jgi:ABC-type uncharacterized transport system substrate-binding protein
MESILIIKSSDNPFFNTTVEKLIVNTRTSTKFNISTLEALQKEAPVILEQDLIITLGVPAAQYTRQHAAHKPIIHSYLTAFQYKSQKEVSNHYSLLLDQPLHRYIDFIKLLLKPKSIGLIQSKLNKFDADTINTIKQNSGIEIDQVIFQVNDNPVSSASNLLKNNDVLLSLPEPDVYNRQSLKGILLTSYRLKKPVISYSPSHVKSGALAAIYTSPENIGEQLALLVDKMAADEQFKPQPFYYAQDYNVVINHQVSESLQLDLADEKVLIEQLKQVATE